MWKCPRKVVPPVLKQILIAYRDSDNPPLVRKVVLFDGIQYYDHFRQQLNPVDVIWWFDIPDVPKNHTKR